MTIPRNLSKLAEGADTSGVLGAGNGGTGLSSPGTSGNVLTSNGTGWTSSPAASGAMALISTQTATSGATTLSWTGLSGYDTYLLIHNSNWTSYGAPGIQIGYGGTPTWLTGSYNFNYSFLAANVFYNGGYVSNSSNFYLDGGSMGIAGLENGFCYIQRCLQTSGQVYLLSTLNNDGGFVGFCDGGRTVSAATTAIRINVTGSGTFSLYGISS